MWTYGASSWSRGWRKMIAVGARLCKTKKPFRDILLTVKTIGVDHGLHTIG